ncbi:aldo/keto reductase [Mariniluteicoccus endophyticus]
MKHVRVGSSGLEVSAITLGCMSFGTPDRGTHPWSMTEEDSRPFLERALELGITTFDTADVYSDGTSEEIVGRALGELANREDVVICTKVNGRMWSGPNGAGLSRRHIMKAVDDSLRRLGTDHVDLYQIHRFDPHTPVEETMEALHDVVKAGKARYIGASSMWTWQLAQMQHAADLGGWTRFISMQDQYSLLSREEEREMHPYCLATGVGVLPWSPLARGRLTRDWDETSARQQSDAFGKTLFQRQEDSDRAIVDAVREVADERGVSRAQVALAWVRQAAAVTSPIVGVTKMHHLNDAVASLSLTLTEAELSRLEDPYTPRDPEGF